MKVPKSLTLGLFPSYAAAVFLPENRDLFARQQGEEQVTVTTVPGTTTTTTVGGTTSATEFAETGTGLTVDGLTTTWTVSSPDTTSTEVPLTGTTTTLSVEGTTVGLVVTENSVVEVGLDGVTTDWVIGEASTQIVIDGTTTTVTVTGSTSVDWTVSPTATTVEFGGTTLTLTMGGDLGDSATTTVILDGLTASVGIEAVQTSVELSGTEVVLGYDGVEASLTITNSESSSESTTEESSTSEESATSEESTGLEESTTSEESTSSEESTTESTSESTNTEESATSEESSSITTEESSTTSGTPSTATSPTATPTANPTYCEVVRGPLTPEEEVQLQVLFSDRAGASAFADYVVSYASQLVAQIDSVANIAVGDNDYALTTAFDTIDIPGILGLASAAPIYTCFLSSLWAEALSNPQQYAKRAVPSQDEKIKLIVLFEKRENSGMQFDYAELLVDETNDLIAEVQSVSAAAANGDLAAYASLFANVDVPYFLSIATEAPIYTEGLSAALQTALASYSESLRPTVTAMTTRTYTVVNTITTNVVSGTVTIPTTYYSTEIVVTVVPAGQVETASRIPQPVPPPTENVPEGYRVTTEVVTLDNGRVETRTVTIREETRAPAPAQTTRRVEATRDVERPNVATYTQVRDGKTYTHVIEIQTRNAAFKKVAALGAGLLGGVAFLL